MVAVFSAVRPRIDTKVYDFDDDDDGYYGFYDYKDDFQDDVIVAEKQYIEYEVNRKLRYWKIGFASIMVILVLSTIINTVVLERTNAGYDAQIQSACNEMVPRFLSEGFSIRYRTSKGFWKFFNPTRVILCKTIDHLPRTKRCNESKQNASADNVARSVWQQASNNSPYIKFMVHVPLGHPPGQAIKVDTPSGQTIMVSVPLGVRPGQQFPVLIPPRFQRQLGSPH